MGTTSKSSSTQLILLFGLHAAVSGEEFIARTRVVGEQPLCQCSNGVLASSLTCQPQAGRAPSGQGARTTDNAYMAQILQGNEEAMPQGGQELTQGCGARVQERQSQT